MQRVKDIAFFAVYFTIRAIYAFNDRLDFASQASATLSRAERRQRR